MSKLIRPSSLFLCALFLSITACKPVQEQKINNKAMPIEPRCITSQSQCEVGNDKVRFTVEFSQYQYQDQLVDNIKTELPVFIQLTELPSGNTANQVANITKVSAYLEGRDMFMGKVPVFFDKKDESTVYLAESLLASCTEEQMVWRLWITAEIAGEEQTFFVDFMSQRL